MAGLTRLFLTTGPTLLRLFVLVLFSILSICVFSSSSLVEMDKWMEDVKMAIEMAKTSNGPSSELLTSSLTDNSKLVRSHTAEYEKLDFVMKQR